MRPIRTRRVVGVVTGRGNFHAGLTRIDFDRLWMQRGTESQPRVLHIEASPERSGLLFGTA